MLGGFEKFIILLQYNARQKGVPPVLKSADIRIYE